jgi:hypothetical protein
MELRARLARIDASLIQRRKTESGRLSELTTRLRQHGTTTRDRSSRPLVDTIAACRRQLAVLDDQIGRAVLAVDPPADNSQPHLDPAAEPIAPAAILEARAQLRGRLLVALSLLDGTLGDATMATVRRPIERALRRLA